VLIAKRRASKVGRKCPRPSFETPRKVRPQDDGGMCGGSAFSFEPCCGLHALIPWRTQAKGEAIVKIVVIGGTGLIGSKTVPILRERGHEVVAASSKTGVNTITAAGLKEALAGAQVVIDLTNSPSFEDSAVLEFFQTSGRNLLAAESAAGVTSRCPSSGSSGRRAMAISAPSSPRKD
jgi:hypothetical protein